MLGTLFENSNYGGSTFTLFGATGCTSTSYGFASLTGGWESRVSSAKGQNGCSLTYTRPITTAVSSGAAPQTYATACRPM